MLFFLQNFLKAIFFGLFCVVTVQARHDFNEDSQLETLSDSFAFEKFLSRKHISKEFKSVYENEDLRKKLCPGDWCQDFFDAELSKYLTTQKIKKKLPKLYALTNKLCKEILETTDYTLEIKIKFDRVDKKIGYNASAEDILAYEGINKHFVLYPTQTTCKKYSLCIQLGQDRLFHSSDILHEKVIAHEIGHIKHQHTL